MIASQLKERLRTDLKAAMRERKAAEVSVLRTLVAALDNAEALPIEGFEQQLRQREAIGEIARRQLDRVSVEAVLAAEAQSRLAAAEDYDAYGRPGDAARLRQEAELIDRYRA
jgi:uncharacterized protein YqeY